MTPDSVPSAKGASPVAEIILYQPEHLNALESRMAEALDRALSDPESDPAVRVLVLRSAGKAFFEKRHPVWKEK